MIATFAAVPQAREPELLALWTESWSEVYAGIDFHARIPWFSGHMAEWVAQGGERIGAFDAAGALLGFILHRTSDGVLDQFCVRRDLKGSGVARALMAEVKRRSPLAVNLTVNAMNARAIRFYEQEGFMMVGEGVNPISGLPTLDYRWQP